jgi:hypothetical protein
MNIDALHEFAWRCHNQFFGTYVNPMRYIKEPVSGASLHRGLERGPLRPRQRAFSIRSYYLNDFMYIIEISMNM